VLRFHTVALSHRKGGVIVMKKKSLFAIAGGGLSLALAAVAIGGFVGNKAKQVGATTGYQMVYDLDLSVSAAVTATTKAAKDYYSYTVEYTQTMLDSTNSISKEWKLYGYNPNNWAVAGTRFGGGKTGTLISALTNGPAGTDKYFCMYAGSTAAFADAITKVEITSLANFGTTTIGKVYLQASANADFSSATNLNTTYTASGTMTFTPTGTVNQYYRIVFEKASSTKNAGLIVSHVKFYKTVETVDPTGITVTGESALTAGGSTTLTAEVAPTTATDKTVTWSTSDASIATVTSAGVVTAINNGTAVITATSNAVSTVTGSITITVSGAPSGTARYIVNGLTSGLPTSYPSGANYTSQGVVFYAANAMYSTSYYQIQIKKDAAACYYNVTAMGADITSLVVNISNCSSAATDFVVTAGSTSNPAGTALTATVTNLAYKYTPATGSRYFKIAGSTTGTTYINSIVVEFGATETAATAAAYVLGIAPDVDSAKDYCIGTGGNYSLAKAVVSGLSATELATFQDSSDATIVSARARYIFWAGRYGDNTPYASTYGTAAGVITGLGNSTSIIAVAVVSVLGLLTLAGVVVLKKKHN
jgi:uncharacterized protein YjdB